MTDSSSGMTFATSIYYILENSAWQQRSRLLPGCDDLPGTRQGILGELRRTLRILNAARREKVLLLDSTSGRIHPDLLASVLIGLWPKRLRPQVVMMGAMWAPDQGVKHLFERWVIRLADRAITRFVVQSSDEMEAFPALWHVNPAKVRCCLYFYTFRPQDIQEPPPPVGEHIFAGGHAHRDYHALREAATLLPDKQFIFATHRLDHHALPPNVTSQWVSHQEFVRLMRSAAVVVTPLQRGIGRAAGQQTYLNAMMLGKPTIVTDGFGVRDHIEHGKTGLIVDGSPQSYAEALNWVFDPANSEAVQRMVAAGQRAALEQFTFRSHVECLTAVMEEVLDEVAARQAQKAHRGAGQTDRERV